jgi:hypothetical protein
MEELGIKSLAMIHSGLFLSIGFFAGKKITNRIDEFLFENSKEYEQMTQELGIPKKSRVIKSHKRR